MVEEKGALVIPGCGVEPGLTEIMARHLAEKLDTVEELHIKCGGIPAVPSGPLHYKIVFGGKRLPLREASARIAQDGDLVDVPRYSGVETFDVEGDRRGGGVARGLHALAAGAGRAEGFEAGHTEDGALAGVRDQGHRVAGVGLLSMTPVEVDGVQVAPKAVVDAILYPHVRMGEDDRDITIFRVEATGKKNGHSRTYRIDMVDRYDEELGFTSMARVTAFTGAIVARMIARGDLQATGWVTPEKVITGPLFDRLVEELAAAGVVFTVTRESRKHLAPAELA